jgi:hypothetical protein
MNPTAPKIERDTPPEAAESEATGLPGLRTWCAVYWLVAGVFAVVVGLLTALTRMFS